MSRFKTIKGKEGEEIAAQFLISLGHEILARNYRYLRFEIDIISTKEEVLFFNEVKHWKESQDFDPRFTFHSAKQNRMRTAANGFLSQHGSFLDHFVSFCLVSVNAKKGCEYYPDLF
ncbi:YraN family protein [Leptospira yasudae]|uniref:YraN family protein n=1 Tax=Leptospira yasudae TaxID=2202201 RepID=UPI0010917DDD|nr:YraN family protein [Leptospira yasudae]MBW0434854.1 YraN family protein [Leptospira yasudae]TGM96256.1 YraN family protein [Leptospira yasudae]